MPKNLTIENDVYDRYSLKWADFPTLITPSAHCDEAELFCAKQSLAVYAAYPNTTTPTHDYIPSRIGNAISEGAFELRRMIEEGKDDSSSSFEVEQGYRTIVTDQAGALLIWKQDHLIIAFRGTANWQDWIHNFTCEVMTRENIENGDSVRLHKGFKGLAENIAPAVIELIGDFLRMRKKNKQVPTLTLCGHSLGGALALNFAAILKKWRPWTEDYLWPLHIDQCPYRLGATYTFGAPRIGKGRIWGVIQRPHYRLVVSGDPVPSLPLGYTSDFQATYLEKSSQPAIQPKTNFGKIMRAATTLVTQKFAFSLTSHYIESYIDSIERKVAAKRQP